MADPTEQILRELDQPVEPRLEFGTRLLDQLLDSLGATTSVAPPARPRFPFLRELVAVAAAGICYRSGNCIQRPPLRPPAVSFSKPTPAEPVAGGDPV